MKNLLRTSVAAATFALLLTAARAADADPGEVEIGQLLPSAKGQYVEVNLSPAMLQFAAKLAAHQEPEAAALIANLRHIRVNVVETDDTNRAGATEQIEAIRKSLVSRGWAQMVSVRDHAKGDNVDIHIRQHGPDEIDGLVVTVIDPKGQAVVVNIVGHINADQIGKLAEHLDLEPLKQVHSRLHGKAPAAPAAPEAPAKAV